MLFIVIIPRKLAFEDLPQYMLFLISKIPAHSSPFSFTNHYEAGSFESQVYFVPTAGYRLPNSLNQMIFSDSILKSRSYA